MERARRNQENSYFHIISGEDYPIKSISDIYNTFLDENKIYMSCQHISEVSGNIRDRFIHYHLSNILNYKASCKIESYIVNKLVKVSNKTKRKPMIGDFNEGNLYKGLVYVSINREGLDYTLNYIKEHPKLLKEMKYILIPEEFFFQTILMNADLKSTIICDDLRYCDWNEKHGNNPAILDMEDFDNLCKTRDLFARRLVNGISDELKININKFLLGNHSIE